MPLRPLTVIWVVWAACTRSVQQSAWIKKPNEPAGEASGLMWGSKSEMNHPHRVTMRKLLVSGGMKRGREVALSERPKEYC